MIWLARLKKQKTTSTHPTKPTELGFVGFVGDPSGHIQKIESVAPAANHKAPALDPDRWCYPYSTAMNTAEIDTFTVRLARFTDWGVILEDAERIADRLVIRDREQDDRVVCVECKYLQGLTCRNWIKAGIAIKAEGAILPSSFTVLLQRCDGFKPAISFAKLRDA